MESYKAIQQNRPTTEHWIQTYSGKTFSLTNPSPESIDIKDIARALSNICRFTGHTSKFYSVSEHSVRVSKELPREYQLVGLLHDAPEAYLSDISSPLKAMLPDYRAVEDTVWRAVAKKWNLPDVLPAIIKTVDRILLATEKRDLMQDGISWSEMSEPLDEIIVPWSPEQAQRRFLNRYNYLMSR